MPSASKRRAVSSLSAWNFARSPGTLPWRAPPSLQGEVGLEDLEGLRPAGELRRHRVADLLADQRPRERGQDRDPSAGRLRFVGADDVVPVFLAALVLEEHRRAERDAIARRRRVDDLGPAHLRLAL